MAEILPGNGLRTAVASDLSAGGTTLSITSADAAKWPTGGDYRAVLCQDPTNGPYEVVKVTGGQGTANLTVTRAAEPYNGDQTARAWVAGTAVSAVITHDSLQQTGGVTWPLYAPDGTFSAPSYSFTNSQTTGIFRDGADAIGFSTGGFSRWRIDGSGHFVAPADNTYDIGQSGATRPRDLFLGRN